MATPAAHQCSRHLGLGEGHGMYVVKKDNKVHLLNELASEHRSRDEVLHPPARQRYFTSLLLNQQPEVCARSKKFFAPWEAR